MKRKRRIRGNYSFAITMLAALAFVVGAVRYWGIPASEVMSTLFAVVVFVAGLAVLALITVAVFKLLRHWFGR
ncbi:MAG TPA: hypothetical protein VIK82_02390 [Porticoccaceae bacterium]